MRNPDEDEGLSCLLFGRTDRRCRFHLAEESCTADSPKAYLDAIARAASPFDSLQRNSCPPIGGETVAAIPPSRRHHGRKNWAGQLSREENSLERGVSPPKASPEKLKVQV